MSGHADTIRRALQEFEDEVPQGDSPLARDALAALDALLVEQDERGRMSSHANTVLRFMDGSEPWVDGFEARDALAALVAQLVEQADRIAWLEGDVAGWRIKLAEAHSALRIIAEHSTDDGSRQLAEAVLEQTSRCVLVTS